MQVADLIMLLMEIPAESTIVIRDDESGKHHNIGRIDVYISKSDASKSVVIVTPEPQEVEVLGLHTAVPVVDD